MEKQEVIEEFCELSTKVMTHFCWQYSADCFCGMNPGKIDDYRFDEKVLEFIKSAVDKKIEEESCK